MKKLLIVLLMLSLLAGCSEANANLTDGNTVIFKTNEKTYTKADLYDQMKGNDYTSIILTKVIDILAEKEELNLDDIKAEIESSYNDMAAQGYEQYIEYYYGGKDNYINQMLSSGILEKLTENYADNNFDDLKNEYAPFKAQIAYFDDEETAKKVLDGAKNETATFETLVTENGSSSDATEQIYTDSSDLPVEVKEAINKMNEAGYADVIKSTTYQTASSTDTTTSTDTQAQEEQTTETNKYYVVKLVSKDVASFKDEFVTLLKTSLLDATKVLNFYFDKYNLEIHDQKTYELLSNTYEVK